MTFWTKIERGTQCDVLGEGALWCPRDQAFYWVDILAPALNRLALASGRIERWDMPEPLGWVVTSAHGGLVGGFRSGIARISLDPLRISPRKAIEAHLPENRMNDGKTDANGTIWCGTMDMSETQASGSLYRISPNGEVQVVDIGYLVPNGPAFSPCGRWMYHADSGRRLIYRFALDDSSAHKKRVFAEFGEDDGYPDGMTTDSEGFVWVAHWDGGRITRFAPDGSRDRTVELPAQRVTSIAFAGERLDRMFVTTAATGLEPSLFDGALFEVDCEVTGNQPIPFDGRLV
jgi:D-xylonolactonase